MMVPGLDPMEFARLAEALRAAPTPTRTAQQIVDYVRDQLHADHVGITLISNRRLETVAATDSLVHLADVFQHQLGEGPGRDASWHRQTLLVGDLATDGRWPSWASRVTALGIGSVLAAELRGRGTRRLGSINVYWTRPRTFSEDDIAFVSIFARHAAIALSASLSETGLYMALDARKRIGQAQGILMERYGLDETRAFEVLRRYSQDHNIKLRHVAEHVLAARQLPPPKQITNNAKATVTRRRGSRRRDAPRLSAGRFDSTAGATD